MLGPGDNAFAFTLKDADGHAVSLADLLQEGDLILYFYPADFTPGCTAEACSIRDMHEDISDLGLQVVGVSPQSETSHQRFAARYELPFPLLCDTDKSVIRGYGVDGPLGFGVRRATFLIGQDGIIRKRVVADLMIGNHTRFIREILKDGAA